jgi:hypothetical protein
VDISGVVETATEMCRRYEKMQGFFPFAPLRVRMTSKNSDNGNSNGKNKQERNTGILRVGASRLRSE